MSAFAFCQAYNEAELIPYWVRHYLEFCDKAIVYVDADSDDGTAEIAEAEGATVRVWEPTSQLDDRVFVDFANTQYHEVIGKADWCIWVDADEFLWHPRGIGQRLDELLAEGVNLPQSGYYVMASDGLPTHPGQIYASPEFRRGLFIMEDGKLAVFNPNQLSLWWDAGKHGAIINGTVVRDDNRDPIKLLHYRWLGEAYLRARDARNYARLNERSKEAGFGRHVAPGYPGPYDPRWSGPGPADAKDVLS